MVSAIAHSLPVAAILLLSPTPIIAVVLLLTTARGLANGVPFVLGRVLALLLVGGAALALVHPRAADAGHRKVVPAWVDIVIGVLLLVTAVWQWHRGPRDADVAPRWTTTVERIGPVGAFGLGVSLAVGPKSLLLLAAGTSAIISQTVSPVGQAAALSVFVAIACLGVAAPVAIHIIKGDHAAEVLASIRRWLLANTTLITASLFLMIGLKVCWTGVTTAMS